jgi:SAM-dependent methyltransferase
VTEEANVLAASYDRIAEEYARRIYDELAHKPFDRALLNYTVESVGTTGTVADIGCGPGHVGRYLWDRGVPTVGIDLSAQMVRLATELNPGMTFHQGTMLDLSAYRDAWAGIVAFYSIIHIPLQELPQVFREFRAALIPGGLLLLAFHLGEQHVHLDDWWGHQVDVDTYFQDPATVERLLGETGFVVEGSVQRLPLPDVEYPSKRAYLFARKMPVPSTIP